MHLFFRVHVRRTDKIKSEAKLHEIEEYMNQVGKTATGILVTFTTYKNYLKKQNL